MVKPVYKFEYMLVWGILLTFATILFFRNAALNPVPAGDEFAYSQMSRHLRYEQDWIPNYIYYFIFSSTNWCGDQYYVCAKVINSFLYVTIALIVFSTVKLFAGLIVSYLFLLAFLISSLNVYTSWFMPETMYALIAWFLAYVYISRGEKWNVSYSAVTGACIAVLCMVKPHGIFLGLAYLISLYVELRSKREDVPGNNTAANIFVFVFSALAFRLIIGFLFAGKEGLNIIGTVYSSIAESRGIYEYPQILVTSFLLIIKHIFALTLLASVPICVLIQRAFRVGQVDGASRRLFNFTTIFFLVMIVVASVFTATVAGRAPGETLGRLHTRYYNFYLFLLFIAAAENIRRDDAGLRLRITTGVIVGAVATFAFLCLPGRFQQGLVDNPEIHGLFYSESWFIVFASGNVLLSVVWIVNSRIACVLFLCFQVPLGLALSAKLLNRDLRSMAEYHNLYPKAGDIARVVWGKPAPEFFVAGNGVQEGWHTLFHIDKSGTLIELLPKERLLQERIPKGIINGIIIGSNDIDFSHRIVFSDGLIRIIKVNVIE